MLHAACFNYVRRNGVNAVKVSYIISKLGINKVIFNVIFYHLKKILGTFDFESWLNLKEHLFSPKCGENYKMEDKVSKCNFNYTWGITLLLSFLWQGSLNSRIDSITGKKTKPWYSANEIMRNIILKNVMYGCDSAVHVTTKAKNVLKPPFMTAGPMFPKLCIDFSSPFSSEHIIKVWAMWAA